MKTNTVTLQAIDGVGNASGQVAIKVGKVSLAADPEIRFNDEAQLDGKDCSFKSTGCNARRLSWNRDMDADQSTVISRRIDKLSLQKIGSKYC